MRHEGGYGILPSVNPSRLPKYNTMFARESFKKKRLEELMEEEFDEVFRFEPNKIHWRGNNTLDLTQIEQLRLSGIISFGSCSFDEPVADLQGLGIL